MDSGIVVVAAAGNYNMDACAYSPASSPHVLTVGCSVACIFNPQSFSLLLSNELIKAQD